jgi:hypothetical protein
MCVSFRTNHCFGLTILGDLSFLSRTEARAMIVRNLAIVLAAMACFGFAIALANGERLDHTPKSGSAPQAWRE